MAFNPSLGNESLAGQLVLAQFTLTFQAPDTEVIFPANETTLRVGEGEDERLYFINSRQPQWTITTSDYGILDHRLFTKNNHLRRQVESIFGRKASNKALIATVSSLACFIFVGLFFSWTLDAIVRHAVAQVPASVEKSFGDKQCEKIKKLIDVSEDPRQIARLNAIFAQLRKGLPDTNLTVQFHIIETGIPNAGSIPGHIFFDRGIFAFLHDPDELAGVMAHELGHITQKHVFRRMVSRQAPAYILKVLFGNSRGAVAALAETSQFVMGQSFSRGYEREADAEGWKYLVAANINPHGFIDAMTKLQEFEYKHMHGAVTLSDHPPTEDRIAFLEARWRKLPRKTGFYEFPDMDLLGVQPQQ